MSLAPGNTSSVNNNTTFTPRRRIQGEGHRNWIRCNLALQEIGDAIRPHVKSTIRDYWDTYLCNCGNRCATSGCATTYPHCHHTPFYWQFHNHAQDWCCHPKKINGQWKLNQRHNCNSCERLFKNLIDCFINPDKIYWGNVEFPLHGKHYWEIAKVFMPEGNKQSNKPEDTEPTALLTVMNNCKLFSENIEHDTLDKVIKKRNKITHNAAHEIDDKETGEIFEIMIDCLQKLHRYYPCQKELTNLKELKERELTGELIEKAWAKHIQDLLNTISDLLASGKDAQHLIKCLESATEMKIQDAVAADYEGEIKQLKDEIDARKIKESFLEDTVKEKEQIIEMQDNKIKDLEGTIQNLQEAMERVKRELTARLDELNTRIAIMQKDIDSKVDEITDLKVRIENLSEKNEEMKMQLIDKDETIEDLEGDLRKLQVENKEIMRKLEEQRTDTRRIQEDLNEMKSANKALKNTIDHKNNEIQSLAKEKEELKKTITKLEQILEEKETRLETITLEKMDLEVRINYLEADVALKETDIAALRQEIIQLNRSNDEKQNAVQSISAYLFISNVVTVWLIVFFFNIGMMFH